MHKPIFCNFEEKYYFRKILKGNQPRRLFCVFFDYSHIVSKRTWLKELTMSWGAKCSDTRPWCYVITLGAQLFSLYHMGLNDRHGRSHCREVTCVHAAPFFSHHLRHRVHFCGQQKPWNCQWKQAARLHAYPPGCDACRTDLRFQFVDDNRWNSGVASEDAWSPSSGSGTWPQPGEHESLDHRWVSVADAGPTLGQRWFVAPCFYWELI